MKHDDLVNVILDSLKNGVPAWRKPYPYNPIPYRVTGEEYKGINWLVLYVTLINSSYSVGKWFTFKSINEISGKIKKAEKGSHVYYFNTLCVNKEGKKVKNDKAHDFDHYVYYKKAYNVWNVAQIENLDDEYYLIENNTSNDINHDTFFDSLGGVVETGAVVPHYRYNKVTQENNKIVIPDIRAFRTSNEYYSTKAHEYIHWTRHKDKLNRFVKISDDEEENYAFEELVAEIGSIMICAKLNIESEIDNNHISYIKSWYTLLNNDNELLFRASALAQKAVNYLFEIYEHYLIAKAS